MQNWKIPSMVRKE